MTRTTSGVTRCVSIQWQANLKDCKKSKSEFGAFPLTALSEWTQLRKVSAAWLQRSTNQDIKMKRESSGITSNRRVCNCSRSSASVGHVARCLMMTQTRNSWSVTWREIFFVETWGCVARGGCAGPHWCSRVWTEQPVQHAVWSPEERSCRLSHISVIFRLLHTFIHVVR